MRKSCFLHFRHLPSSKSLFQHGFILKKARLPYFQRQCSRTYCTTGFKSTKSTNRTRVLYEPIENVERMEYYQPGGYHPVKIGDHFHNRYEIVHKLGHGAYSTIWLARDEKSDRYVSLKVCTADSNPLEIEVLS